MKIEKLPIIIIIFVLAANAFAHEYWFETDNFRPAPSEKSVVHLYVGDGLVRDREERPFQPDKTPDFRLFSKNSTTDLKTSLAEGSLPIYNFSADREGTYLLAMERNWSYIVIDAAKFENYLREDGLDYIIPERAAAGESTKEGRERYSRFLKCLLQVGDRRDDTYKKRVGMKLEIVPLENPYSKKVGDTLRLQIFFDGRPLAGHTVFADNRASTTQKMTTDKTGKFTIRLDQNGMWLVRLVFMRRCATGCGAADWESFWGAVTFGIEETTK
ncbi:MAG: DUF4198 domain-containing protein [Acidobacteria bacterium]|nr:DUF4198 domain-containing protein [Acidobacteriota bacterium]